MVDEVHSLWLRIRRVGNSLLRRSGLERTRGGTWRGAGFGPSLRDKFRPQRRHSQSNSERGAILPHGGEFGWALGAKREGTTTSSRPSERGSIAVQRIELGPSKAATINRAAGQPAQIRQRGTCREGSSAPETLKLDAADFTQNDAGGGCCNCRAKVFPGKFAWVSAPAARTVGRIVCSTSLRNCR